LRLSVDSSRCTGCNSCEMICYFVKSGMFNTKKSCIRVLHLGYVGFSNPVVCVQCKNPSCVNACPVGALTQTELGTIKVDLKRCNGCRICEAACVIGAINFVDSFPQFCDLCGGKPKCVDWCPTGAIICTGTKQPETNTKALSVSISRAKKILKERGLPENALDWYEIFT